RGLCRGADADQTGRCRRRAGVLGRHLRADAAVVRRAEPSTREILAGAHWPDQQSRGPAADGGGWCRGGGAARLGGGAGRAAATAARVAGGLSSTSPEGEVGAQRRVRASGLAMEHSPSPELLRNSTSPYGRGGAKGRLHRKKPPHAKRGDGFSVAPHRL